MRMKRIVAGVAALGAAGSLGVASAQAEAAPAAPQGPKNVIVLIGDGLGYNQIAAATLFENGVSYKQVAGAPGAVVEVTGEASLAYESFPVQVDMATFADGGSYDPEQAWTDFGYVKINPTDSAAAGTAMATGIKTYNAGVGVDPDGNPVENLSERAIALGKAAGVVSSVQFSHATPAAYAVHNVHRNNYLDIAASEVASDLTVVMGAGHPWYTDGGDRRTTPSYRYISETDYDALADGSAGWELVESEADFEALTDGDTPERVFGIAEVATTLQQSRPGTSTEPFAVPFNENVPDLATMTAGALNVLDNDADGFSLMVEGGAIDWSGHANSSARNIEETMDFNQAVDTVIEWVEENSSWKETLVIVAGDHETGYLEGAGSGEVWTLLEGSAGQVPAVAWHSGNHTNMLVPVYAKGAGAKELGRLATMTDPVRGAYLDNTDLANVLLEDLWAAGPGASAGQSNGKAVGRG